MSYDRRTLIFIVLVVVATASMIAAFYHGQERAGTIDCTNQSYTCGTVELDRAATRCEPWSPWDPVSELNCSYSKELASEVSLRSDPANYVTEPRTDSDYRVETFNRTGKVPWDLAILPSGDKLWTNRNSGELRMKSGDDVETIAEFEVFNRSYNGLMGLALDPEFEDNRRIYLFKADRGAENNASIGPEKTIVNHIVSFRLENASLEDRKLVFKTAGGKKNAGGRISFGPEGKMYVSSMEPAMYSNIENPDFPGSYILRVNRDGSVPEDNPFNGSRIFSMGHRNAQGLAFHPETGELYSSEHGPWRHDEINRIRSGKNYGWAGYRCDEKLTEENKHGADPTNYNPVLPNTPPAFCFDDWSLAPSGMTFVDEPGHQWENDLFVAGLRGNHIHRFIFEDGEIVDNEMFYTSSDEEEVHLRLRDVEYFNGSLYAIADRSGGMVKITPE